MTFGPRESGLFQQTGGVPIANDNQRPLQSGLATLKAGRRLRLKLAIVACSVGLGLVAGVACSATPRAAQEAPPPSISGVVRSPQPLVGSVALPDISATPSGSSPVDFRLRAQQGGLLLVYFGYTSCPDVCPATLSNLKSAFGSLGSQASQLSVAFVTVDPDRDTPQVMDAYLSHFFTEFHALRSTDEARLKAAKEAFGVVSQKVPEAGGGYSVSHSAGTFVVDSAGRLVVEWPFGTKPGQMSEDLKILLGQGGPAGQ